MREFHRTVADVDAAIGRTQEALSSVQQPLRDAWTLPLSEVRKRISEVEGSAKHLKKRLRQLRAKRRKLVAREEGARGGCSTSTTTSRTPPRPARTRATRERAW